MKQNKTVIFIANKKKLVHFYICKLIKDGAIFFFIKMNVCQMHALVIHT